MTDADRIPLERAEPVARALFAELEPTCDDILIAGSIRRRSPTVKDCEFVIRPTTMTYQLIDRMVFEGAAERADYGGTERWGKKYRGLKYFDMTCELWFTDAASWGYQLWLRTGPADANKVVMQKMQDSEMRCLDGAVWVTDDWQYAGDKWASETRRRVNVPDETRMFHLLGMEWIEPKARTVEVYQRYVGSARTPFAPNANWFVVEQQPKQLSLL